MISLPNWLFAVVMYFAGIGFCVIAWNIYLLWDEHYSKRKTKRQEDIEYQELCDGLIAEIERELRGSNEK